MSKITDDTKRKVLELRQSGYKLSEIHNMLGIAHSSVRTILINADMYEKDDMGVNRKVLEERMSKCISLYRKGKTVKEIREETGLTNTTIIRYLKADGCYVDGRTLVDKEGKKFKNTKSNRNRDKIIELHREGINTYEIAERVGMCEQAVRKLLIETNEFNDAVNKRQRIRPTKSNKNRDKIIELHRNGVSTYEIAYNVGMSEVTVRKLLKAENEFNETINKKQKIKYRAPEDNDNSNDSIIYINDIENPERDHPQFEEALLEKELIISRFNGDDTAKNISKELCLDIRLIRCLLLTWAIELTSDKNKDMKKILKLYAIGVTIPDIAKALGMQRAEVIGKLSSWDAYEMLKNM